ncbi:MAG: hypothetical protein HQM09_05150 [Candidatus Riflebacteria bacterium]|nr:hypothetical protein [Candidatus Riflebacteria bacterium]
MNLRNIPIIFLICIFFAARHPVQAQPASEPVYNLDLVDIYAELYPEKSEAWMIADIYFSCNGSDPVALRWDGNFTQLDLTFSDDPNPWYVRSAPYSWFYHLASGPHRIKLTGRVQCPSSELSTNLVNFGPSSFWYPRNNASDPHQVMLNLVTPPDFSIQSNASMVRDLPYNFKRMRTYELSTPLAEGLTLTGKR